MISVSQALSILSEYVVTTDIENIHLLDAVGRKLSQDVMTDLTLPPHDASAMDGYAVRLADVARVGSQLNVIGEVPAGHRFKGQVLNGEAVRIFTGSPVPTGADHIIIQENVERNGNIINVMTAATTSKHIRRAGIDFKKGDIILHKGQRLDEANIALAAASNHATLPVFQSPKISILAAGDELVPVGSAHKDGDIVNSNRAALSALVRLWGGTVHMTALTKDDPKAIRDMFLQAKHSDIIVPVGGASVGDHDHMRRVFTDLGGEIIFEKVAVKPGKPTWFGMLDGVPVLGLPGNPASAIICAHLFLKPLIGGPSARFTQARLSTGLRSNGPRETYLRARLWADDTTLHVKPFPRQDSSLLTPFQTANVLIRRPSNSEALTAGQSIEVLELGTGPSLIDPFE